MRIGIVVSEFHYDITGVMLERARQHAEFLGLEVVDIVTVPGVYDIPIALKNMLKRDEIEGAVALGAVIEGETEHDEIVMGQTSRKIVDLSVEYEKPVGLGITGPGMTRLQAEERIDRAKHAVEAVAKLHKRLKKQ
ncbi:MAG: 6,7-dimethyl-8-ribityllumazine synthase [Thermoplasmata archaeon]